MCSVFQVSRSLTAKNTTTAPYPRQSARKAVSSVCCHGGLDNFQRLTKGGHLEHVQASAQQQVAELDGLLFQLRRGIRGENS